jgi:predicted nucleotidyltransferase
VDYTLGAFEMKEMNEFLKRRNVDEKVIENIGYVAPAGSILFGTNNQDSDRDYRGIVIPTKEEIYGLKSFEFSKIAEGKGGINLKNDLDIELYSLKKFFNGLIDGNPIEMEMLFVPEITMVKKDEILNEIFERKYEFISKKFIHRYLSMNIGFVKKIDSIPSNLKNPLSKKRIENFGFETKNASKALQHLYLLDEYLETSNLILFRKEKQKLLDIKNGKYQKSEIVEEINFLTRKIEEKKEFSQIPIKPDYNSVNGMYVNVVKKILGVC